MADGWLRVSSLVDVGDKMAIRDPEAVERLIAAGKVWYAELLRIGHYKPGEVRTFDHFRSDRWACEVELAAAIESLDDNMPVMCRTDDVRPHRWATALVDDEPRCESCLNHIRKMCPEVEVVMLEMCGWEPTDVPWARGHSCKLEIGHEGRHFLDR